MVRAPKPVACGGMTETLLDEDDGVAMGAAAFLTGVRTAFVEQERECSAGPDAVR